MDVGFSERYFLNDVAWTVEEKDQLILLLKISINETLEQTSYSQATM